MKTFKFFSLCVGVLAFTLTACDKSNEPNGGNSENPTDTGYKLVKKITVTGGGDVGIYEYHYTDHNKLSRITLTPKDGKESSNYVFIQIGDTLFYNTFGDNYKCKLNSEGNIVEKYASECATCRVYTTKYEYNADGYMISRYYTGSNNTGTYMWENGNLIKDPESLSYVYGTMVSNSNLSVTSCFIDLEVATLSRFSENGMSVVVHSGYCGKPSKNLPVGQISKWGATSVDYKFDAGNHVTELTIFDFDGSSATAYIEYY